MRLVNFLRFIVTFSFAYLAMYSYASQNHFGEKFQKGNIVDFSQDGYSFTECKPFEKPENFFKLSCRTKYSQNLTPIPENDLAEYKKLFWKTKNNQMYKELKEMALLTADKAISKMRGNLKCFSENPPEFVSVNNKRILCSDLSLKLLLDLNNWFPTFRTASALKGTKSRSMTDLNAGLTRPRNLLTKHIQKLRDTYKDLDETETDTLLEASEAFTVFPYHPFQNENNLTSPLTVKEIKRALYLYKRATPNLELSLHSKEQSWLAKNINDSESKGCIKRHVNEFKESQYRFVSYHVKSERDLAIKCGNNYYKECAPTPGIGAGGITCRINNKLQKNSPYFNFLKSTNPNRVNSSININMRNNWSKTYNSILESSPYFSLINLTSEDLIEDKDLTDQSLFDQKLNLIIKQLKSAFEKLLQNSIQAKKEINNMQSLNELMVLNSLTSNFLASKKPLSKADCDVAQAAFNWNQSKDTMRSLGFAAVSISGALACPATFGLGCLATLGSETLELKRQTHKVDLAEKYLSTNSLDLESYANAKQNLSTSYALAPLVMFGLPIVKSSLSFTRIGSSLKSKFLAPKKVDLKTSYSLQSKGSVKAKTLTFIKRGSADKTSEILFNKVSDINSKTSQKIGKLLKKREKLKSTLNSDDPFKTEDILDLTEEMIALNDNALKEIQASLKEIGIKSKLKRLAGSRSSYSLVLDLSSESNSSIRSLNRINDKFNGNEMTINFYENLEGNSLGFFNQGSKRIELGVEQAKQFHKNKITGTTRHELRHLMFQQMREMRVPSIYHQRYYAKDGTKLNPDNKSDFYSDFLSAEEIYTHSTDIGEIARGFKRDTSNGLSRSKSEYIKSIKNKVHGVSIISENIIKLNKNNITILETFLKAIKTEKSFTLIPEVLDKYGVKFLGSGELAIVNSKGATTVINTNYNLNLFDQLELALEEIIKNQKTMSAVAEHQLKAAKEINRFGFFTNIFRSSTNIDAFTEKAMQFSHNVKENHNNFKKIKDTVD